jgi:oxygen-independent coproporphyrinogen-3 oxidase
MLGVYVHVPFCATRCGYCDFTTYTAGELRGYPRSAWAGSAVAEVALAARTLGPDAGPVGTVFFGGGTPTLLPPADLLAVLGAIDERLGLAPGAEVTVEANPDAVDPAALAALRAGGVTRLSIGMQSARPHVLAAWTGPTPTGARPPPRGRRARPASRTCRSTSSSGRTASGRRTGRRRWRRPSRPARTTSASTA